MQTFCANIINLMCPTSGLLCMHNLSAWKMCPFSENLMLGWWVSAIPSLQRLQALSRDHINPEYK